MSLRLRVLLVLLFLLLFVGAPLAPAPRARPVRRDRRGHHRAQARSRPRGGEGGGGATGSRRGRCWPCGPATWCAPATTPRPRCCSPAGAARCGSRDANGAFTVPAAAAAGQGQRARALVEASLGFLAGTTRESSQAVLATRSATRPPIIVSPRNGRVLPEPLAFEWLGSRFSHYTVRLVGPAGPVVDRREVTGARWELSRRRAPAHGRRALHPAGRRGRLAAAGGVVRGGGRGAGPRGRGRPGGPRAGAGTLGVTDLARGAAGRGCSRARGSSTTRGGWWWPASRRTATSRPSTCCWATSIPAPGSPTSPPNPSTRPATSHK